MSGEATCRNNTCICADLHGRVWARRGKGCAGRQMRRCHGKWWVRGSVVFQLIQWAQQMSSSFIRLRTGVFVITVGVTSQTTLHQTASGWGCSAPGGSRAGIKNHLSCWTLCLSFVGASVPECGLFATHCINRWSAWRTELLLKVLPWLIFHLHLPFVFIQLDNPDEQAAQIRRELDGRLQMAEQIAKVKKKSTVINNLFV